MTVRFGPFELDPVRRQLFRDGREIHLTPKAFALLSALVEAAPRVVPKAELHERLWPQSIVSDATLVGVVKEVRRALAEGEQLTPLIRTAHRVGYAFDGPIAPAPHRSSMSQWLIAGERRIVLVEGENSIGRDPEAGVLLDYSTVSRRHARLTVSQAGAVLEDLGSKNGTTVNGERLTGAVLLRDGDCFACGQALVTYRQSTASIATATHVGRAADAPIRT